MHSIEELQNMLQNPLMLEVIRRRPALFSGLAVFITLLLTTDDRFLGSIPDEMQMTSSAVALSHFGEIGVSSNWAYVAHPREGEWFSRYGFLQSLLLVPSTLSARLLGVAAPGLNSTPVFSLLQILLLSIAAAFTARSGERLGSTPGSAFAAGVLLIFSTPLWAYSGTGYSEPLQAASLSVAFTAALAAHRETENEPWRGFGHGICIGIPLLAKSSLVVPVAAFLVLALLPDRQLDGTAKRKRKAFREAHSSSKRRPFTLLAGFALPSASWAALELYRFGRLFGGYEAEGFDYPFFTGLLRLTVLPNKGLLFYAPLVFLAVPGLRFLFRRDPAASLTLGAAILSPFVLAAGWWAWDGQAAWGPRLVLTSLPFLFMLVAAGLSEAGGFGRRFAAFLALAGIAINSLGALQPFAGVYAVASSVPPGPIPAARAAGTPYEIEQGADGTLFATAPHHISLTPSWTPIRIHALFLMRRLGGTPFTAWLAEGLPLDPPFRVSLPAQPSPVFRAAVSPFRWPIWGRSWLAPDGDAVDPYADALLDQVRRAAETKNWRRAAWIAERTLSWPKSRRNHALLRIGADAATASGDRELAERIRVAASR